MPSAIFVANIMSAIGAISAIRSRGLRVPDDISVVGFHDVPLAGYLDPPLTTVRMPLHELGARAVDQLLTGGGEPETRVDRHAAGARRAERPPRRRAARQLGVSTTR